jgi:hypothetical protein
MYRGPISLLKLDYVSRNSLKTSPELNELINDFSYSFKKGQKKSSSVWYGDFEITIRFSSQSLNIICLNNRIIEMNFTDQINMHSLLNCADQIFKENFDRPFYEFFNHYSDERGDYIVYNEEQGYVFRQPVGFEYCVQYLVIGNYKYISEPIYLIKPSKFYSLNVNNEKDQEFYILKPKSYFLADLSKQPIVDEEYNRQILMSLKTNIEELISLTHYKSENNRLYVKKENLWENPTGTELYRIIKENPVKVSNKMPCMPGSITNYIVEEKRKNKEYGVNLFWSYISPGLNYTMKYGGAIAQDILLDQEKLGALLKIRNKDKDLKAELNKLILKRNDITKDVKKNLKSIIEKWGYGNVNWAIQSF